MLPITDTDRADIQRRFASVGKGPGKMAGPLASEAAETLLSDTRSVPPRGRRREGRLRERYLRAGLAQIPRLLTAIDRNPFRATYGCMDRQYWHYRTAAFASGMYQEGALALAMVYAYSLPDNPWYGCGRVRELAEAAVRFAARSSHPDGSCDDYYPFERALGAVVFSFVACVRTCELLGLDDPELLDWLRRRGRWIARYGETGRLTNHHALAALGLAHLARWSQQEEFLHAAQAKLQTVLAWQHPEGWFDEYGGADPGYQTLTIDCLAKLRRLVDERLSEGWKDWSGQKVHISQALDRAVRFARWFLHPDGSYGGPYGSRGTRLFFPHGMELLAGEIPEAAELADGFLLSLEGPGTSQPAEEGREAASCRFVPPATSQVQIDQNVHPHSFGLGRTIGLEIHRDIFSASSFVCPEVKGTFAHLQDDRMIVHWPAQWIEAYRDWSLWAALRPEDSPSADSAQRQTSEQVYWPAAGLFVRRSSNSYTAVSTARGGVLIHFISHSAVGAQRETSAPKHSEVWADHGLGNWKAGAATGWPGAAAAWLPVSDVGLVVETTDGRLAVSSLLQLDAQQPPTICVGTDGSVCLEVHQQLCWVRWETASPLKQALFHLAMCLAGRLCRSGVRWWLQRRLITGRRKAPIRLTRQIEWPGRDWNLPAPDRPGQSGGPGIYWQRPVFPLALPEAPKPSCQNQEIYEQKSISLTAWTLRVTDTIVLLDRRIRVRRMAYGPEGDWVYVAASGAYQPLVLAPWIDLAEQVEPLHRTGRVVIQREW